MQIDKDLIKKLQNTDDETLKSTIKMIAQSLGANDKQTANALNNVGTIKKKLSSMSDSEIQRQVNKQVRRIGEDKANEIIKNIKI